jgi:hypothetical protein
MCETAQSQVSVPSNLAIMTARYGDHARLDRHQKRKLDGRRRLQAWRARLRKKADEKAALRVAALNMQDEGGPARIGD